MASNISCITNKFSLGRNECTNIFLNVNGLGLNFILTDKI